VTTRRLSFRAFLTVIASEARQSQESKTQKAKGKNKSEVKDQNEEGFYIIDLSF
jgi:hypothetical protein